MIWFSICASVDCSVCLSRPIAYMKGSFRHRRAAHKGTEAGFKTASDTELRFASGSFKMRYVRRTGDTMVRQKSLDEVARHHKAEKHAWTEDQTTFSQWMDRRLKQVLEDQSDMVLD